MSRRAISTIILFSLLLIITLVSSCASAEATPTAVSVKPSASTPAAISTPTSPTSPTATLSPTVRRGGTVKVAQRVKPETFDPMGSYTAGNGPMMSLIYDTLVEVDEKGKVGPSLAESWDVSSDGKTITFKLRKGIKFHDGTPFNAEAAKFHLERIRTSTKRGGRATTLVAKVTSAEALDESTVRVNLSAPSASLFFHSLNEHAGGVVSPAAVQKWGDDYPLHPIGTGPFKLADFKLDVSTTLEANKDYWKKGLDGKALPYIDTSIFLPITDETVRLTNLKTGQVDIIEAVAPKDLASLWQTKDLNLIESTAGDNIYFAFRCDQPPFDNLALRQAVAYAIDKEAILKAVEFGAGTVGQTVVAPAYGDIYDPAVKSFPYDKAKAKEKLKKGGKPEGFSFAAYVTSSPVDVQRAEAIQRQLAEVGIKMDIQVVDQTKIITILQRGEYQAYISYTALSTEPFFGGAQNFLPPRLKYGSSFYWDNPKYVELFDKLEATYNTTGQKAVWSEMQKILAEEVPAVYLSHTVKAYATSKNVRDLIPSLLRTIRVDRVWLDK